jgi:hypothetical protein
MDCDDVPRYRFGGHRGFPRPRSEATVYLAQRLADIDRERFGDHGRFFALLGLWQSSQP